MFLLMLGTFVLASMMLRSFGRLLWLSCSNADSLSCRSRCVN